MQSRGRVHQRGGQRGHRKQQVLTVVEHNQKVPTLHRIRQRVSSTPGAECHVQRASNGRRELRAVGDERRLDHALMQLAESLFVQGKATEAIGVRREVVEYIGQRRVNYAASNLANLCAALTFNDELDEALHTARLAFPLLQHEGSLSTYADHFALLACKLGRHAEGARLLGRADANFRASGFEREESELRAARMTRDVPHQAMPTHELDKLMTEGAAMSDEASARAALGIDRRRTERMA